MGPHDLVRKTARLDGRDRLPVALQGELVLVGSTDLVLDRHPLGMGAHVAAFGAAPQAVVNGRIDQLGIAQPVAEARLGDQVRALVHALHAAGDGDLGVAGPDLGGGEHDRLEATAANAVDRRRAGGVRQAGLEYGLARRRLTGAGLQHLAHQHLVDRRAVGQAGALTAALMAMPPRVVAGTSASEPLNLPIGVRAAETMKTWPFQSPRHLT